MEKRQSDEPEQLVPQGTTAKRPYQQPVLQVYGAIREMTTGSSGTLGDGGATKRLK